MGLLDTGFFACVPCTGLQIGKKVRNFFLFVFSQLRKLHVFNQIFVLLILKHWLDPVDGIFRTAAAHLMIF